MPCGHSLIFLDSTNTVTSHKMYVQQLEKYRHDIAERHSSCVSLAQELLFTEPEARDLLISCHSKANHVKMTHKLIEYCLQSEERAKRFLEVLRAINPRLYADLSERGPRGKFVRAVPPVVRITDKAKEALGTQIEDLRNAMILPAYTKTIVNVLSIIDVLMAYDQLLPDEYQDILMNCANYYGMVMQLAYVCRDPSIPECNRRFMSLVAASYNMHMFGIDHMSMQDVLVFP